MDHGPTIPYLREAIIFLVVAGVVVPGFHRFRVSPVLGFLLAGLVLGPAGLIAVLGAPGPTVWLIIFDKEGVATVSELGVVLLLFLIGLELSLARLWSLRRLVLGFGGLQVLATAAVIGAVFWWFDQRPYAALIVALALALSSTAIVMQELTRRRALGTALGRTCFAVLLLQDLAVVPILVLAATPEGGDAWAFAATLGRALATAVVAVGAILLAGRYVIRPLFRAVAMLRQRELFFALTLLTILGTAALTGVAGLSLALGAFLAGLLLSESAYRHEIELDIEPFKGLLLGLFFLSVGLRLDLAHLADHWTAILAGAVGLYVLKATIIAALAAAFGLPRHTALETGLVLGQAGEFGFVVIGQAVLAGTVSEAAVQLIFAIVVTSMIATPLVVPLAGALARRLADGAARADADIDQAPDTLEDHVIVCGAGRVGRMAARLLDAVAIPYVTVDRDIVRIERLHAEGVPGYLGDCRRPELLQRMHADRASAVLVTLDDRDAAEQTIRAARGRWPALPIFARAHDPEHARRLIAAGATDVVPETTEGTLQLGARLLEGLGLPVDLVQDRIGAERRAERLQLDGG